MSNNTNQSKNIDELFQQFQSNSSQHEKMQLKPEELSRFQQAFQDAHFQDLFREYLDEIQDPKNRQENEAYIRQLESENKIPQGKELIHPNPCFVAKSKKIENTNEIKLFLNIVSCDKIHIPIKESTDKGDAWSIPYSLGPPRIEKDKIGSNVLTFDCCFHSQAINQSNLDIRFQKVLIQTACDGVIEYYKRNNQQVSIDKDYKVLKGVKYISGDVKSMMITIESKQNWMQSNTIESQLKKSNSSHLKKGFLLDTKASLSSSLNDQLEYEVKESKKNPKHPIFSILERGKLDLGEFESISSNSVGSNRPAELVYRFSLPLVSKPSNITLDVTEQQIHLTYKDIYDLNISLTYPVLDKKGTAKYDKKEKTLTVTLPVKSHERIVISRPLIDTSIPLVSSIETMDSTNTLELNKSTKSKDETKKLEHDRWITKSLDNEDKTREIANFLQSELEKNKNISEMKETKLAASEDIIKVNNVEKELDLDLEFIPAMSFKGSKLGYLFTLGMNGLGYYRDAMYNSNISSTSVSSTSISSTSVSSTNISSTSISSTSISSTSTLAMNNQDIPFEFRQTTTFMSIIVHISHVIKPSLQYLFTKDSVILSFKALKESSNDITNILSYSFQLSINSLKKELYQFNNSQSKVDLSTENIAIILMKHENCQCLWNDENLIQLLDVKDMKEICIEDKQKETITNLSMIKNAMEQMRLSSINSSVLDLD